jgi:uncharacterized protein YjbJ (UPF0337 family)
MIKEYSSLLRVVFWLHEYFRILSHHKSDAMNTNVIGYWNKKKEKLKQKFPVITDEDLLYNEGKEKEMIEMLGNKLGKSKQELLNIIVAI